MDDDVSGIFPAFDAQKNHITKVSEYIRPVICVWLSGRRQKMLTDLPEPPKEDENG